jgi:hypothetical protein
VAQHNNIMPSASAVAQAPAAVDALMRPPALEPFSKPPPAVSFLDHRDVFMCDEESTFYSACLQELIFDAEHCSSVIEFGSGDGSPVLNALARSNFRGVINGFELNPKAATLARRSAQAMQLQDSFKVHNSCFFAGAAALPETEALVANPPYIAAPDDDLLMPALHGGPDGANLTRDLMSMGFNTAMLLLCSYCDPVRTLAHAKNEGYSVVDYRVTDLPFGVYSAEPKVLDWIRGMRDNGRAFFGDGSYRLAGVLLRKEDTLERDGLPALERDGAGSEEGSSGDERGSASDSSTASTGTTDRSAELLRILMAA